MSGIEVLAPGLLTTVQAGDAKVCATSASASAGALDPDTHAIANLLVGNVASAATLEIALAGPTLRFAHPARIALCGAAFDAGIDGEALPGWRRVDIPAGSVLRIGGCREGARAWLAVAGGIRVAEVLGSASTDLRGGFGGVEGRALRVGDRLRVEPFADAVERVRIAPWWIDPHALDPPAPMPIRVLPGDDATDPGDGLFEREWTLAAASDRQGLRLDGGSLALRDAREYVSEPIVPGTVQLPPGGNPSCCWPTRRPTAAIRASATSSAPTAAAWRNCARASACGSRRARTRRPSPRRGSGRTRWRRSHWRSDPETSSEPETVRGEEDCRSRRLSNPSRTTQTQKAIMGNRDIAWPAPALRLPDKRLVSALSPRRAVAMRPIRAFALTACIALALAGCKQNASNDASTAPATPARPPPPTTTRRSTRRWTRSSTATSSTTRCSPPAPASTNTTASCRITAPEGLKATADWLHAQRDVSPRSPTTSSTNRAASAATTRWR